LAALHAALATASGAARRERNVRPARLSVPQPVQVMLGRPRPSDGHWRNRRPEANGDRAVGQGMRAV
jgi:hypothetical protein